MFLCDYVFYKYLILLSAWMELCLGDSSSRCLALPDICFGSTSTCLFCVTRCWSHVWYLQSFEDTRPSPKAGKPQEDLHWHRWLWTRFRHCVSPSKKGTNAVLCCVALLENAASYLQSFKFQSATPSIISHFCIMSKNLKTFILPFVCFQSKLGNLIILARIEFLYQLLKYLYYFCIPSFGLILF